ncbi:MAG: hypothetical protein RL189_2907 [Pseudomonadota bacterium]
MVIQRFMLPIIFAGFFACKSRTYNTASSPSMDQSSKEVSRERPPQFPDGKSTEPWGGRLEAKWKAEAVFADALGDAMNIAWSEKDIADVLVAVPTKFSYGNFNPYGDGQVNTAMEFNSAWTHKRPQVVAALKHYSNNRPSRVVVRFDRALVQSQSEIELRFRNSPTVPSVDLRVKASKTSDGDLVAEFDAPGDWNMAGKGQEDRMIHSASSGSALVRPAGQFNDWFPLTFKHPVSTTERLTRSVNPQLRVFSAAAGVPFPENLADPMGLKPVGDQENSFSKALSLEIDKKWPKSFNNAHYASCNVHGNFASRWDAANAKNSFPTAVGRNWTWLTNPENSLNQPAQGPFKILYTCFEPRRVNKPPTVDSACVGQPTEGTEAQHGVPSGAGWHLIGDPAETLFNSVERVPLMMAAGFAAPHERISLNPPTGGIAYGLKDVAVARWLHPDEAFLTARSKDPTRPNFHWFLFHADEHVCTLEWVHPCVPDEASEPSFGGTSCK